MFSIGKINPDSRIVGNISPISEIKIACCIFFDTVDINIPRVKLIKIYNIHSARRSIILPFTGRPNTNHDNASMRRTLIKERKK